MEAPVNRLDRAGAPATGRNSWSKTATVAVLIVLAACALRFTHFTARSMWLDEGTTLNRISGSWSDLFLSVVDIQGTEMIDPHPPLYFATLRVWRGLVGTGEFASKALAGFAGVAAVAVTYALSRRLLGRRAGLIGMLMALLCAGYQWYSQEIRHYSWFFCLAALMLYAQARFIVLAPRRSNASRRNMIVAWLGISLVGVASHYLLAVLWVGQVAALLLMGLASRTLASRGGRLWGGGLIGLLIVAALAYAIVAPAQAGKLVAATNIASVVDVVPLLMTGTIFGLTAADPTGGWLDKAILLLVGAGLLIAFVPVVRGMITRPGARWGRREALAAVALSSLLALCGICYLQRGTNTFRYAIMLSPTVLLMMTTVIETILPRHILRQRLRPTLSLSRTALGGALLAGVLAVESFGVASATLPSLIKYDDWRGLVRYLGQHWRPGDALVIEPLYTPYRLVQYYLNGVPVPVLPINGLLANEADPTATLRQNYARVWYINAGAQPIPTVGNGMFTSFYFRDMQAFRSDTTILQLDLFETTPPVVDVLPATATALSPVSPTSAHPDIAGYELHACDVALPLPCSWLSLYWRRNAATDLGDNVYQLAVRLEADQVTWASLQTPAHLGAAATLTPSWSTTQLYRVDYLLPLPIGLPSLDYQLNLTVQYGDKREPVATAAPVLTPAQVSSAIRLTQGFGIETQTPLWTDGDVALTQAEFPSTARPGSIVPLALTWRADRALASPADDWQTAIRIEPLIGAALAQSLQPASVVNSPITAWPAQQPIRALASVQLPFDIAPGFYKLMAARVRADGRESGTTLGLIQVEPFPFSQLPDEPVVRVTAQAGEANLLGYRLDQPIERGTTLNFYTYWQMAQTPLRDGVLVLFVFGPDGKPIAQDDSPPEQGLRSTLTYRAGEGIKQLHRIVLPPDAPAGVYHLRAGIYNRSDQQRWEAVQNGAPARDMLIDLGTIELSKEQ